MKEDRKKEKKHDTDVISHAGTPKEEDKSKETWHVRVHEEWRVGGGDEVAPLVSLVAIFEPPHSSTMRHQQQRQQQRWRRKENQQRQQQKGKDAG